MKNLDNQMSVDNVSLPDVNDRTYPKFTLIDPIEFQHLVHALQKPTYKLVTELLFYTGMRMFEILSLSQRDVNLHRKCIYVNGKGAQRMIPICPPLEELLVEYQSQQDHAEPEDKFIQVDPDVNITTGKLNRELKQACKKLGWSKHVTSKMFRWSFGQILFLEGMPLSRVMCLLGGGHHRCMHFIRPWDQEYRFYMKYFGALTPPAMDFYVSSVNE